MEVLVEELLHIIIHQVQELQVKVMLVETPRMLMMLVVVVEQVALHLTQLL